MEHASIAAFARFALELLSLGAPPDLLMQAHQALADETAHARDAFALASAYAGRPVGPGSLDVGGALAARTPLAIVTTAILEGCIGETVAAVEATEALAHATDPAVRTALERIAVDETRHAELAWRFVQWVLRAGDADLREHLSTHLVAQFESELEAARATTAPVTRAANSAADAARRAHGVLDEATRQEIRRRVLAEVALPCAQALIASGTSPKRRTEVTASSSAPRSASMT
jgi:hypothetical protein